MNVRLCGEDFIKALGEILSQRERKVIDNPSFTRAAVLIPLFNKQNECHILLTKRTEQVKYHKGQISFPGGGVDETDVDLRSTALREAFEEIGLKREDVQIIGALDDIETVTEFIVTPFVGYFVYPYPFRLSEIEIEELIEVPLGSLLDPSVFSESLMAHGQTWRRVYHYQFGRYDIWGATALILKQFFELLPTS